MAKAAKGPTGPRIERTYRAEGSGIVRGIALIPGTAEDQVKVPAAVATGNLKVVGIAAEDAAAGEPVRVIEQGECVAIALAAIVLGDSLKTAGVAGKVEPTTTDNDGVFAHAISAAAADGDEVVILVDGPSRY